MARSHHDNENTDIENFALWTICFDKQQLLKNNIKDHEIKSITKPTKKQDYESSFKIKLLRKYITSQLEDVDLIHSYTNFKEQLLN